MTAPARFRHLRKFLGPRWLTTDDDGEPDPVGYSLDLVKDGFIERLRLGLMARLPQNDPSGVTTAPTDALEAMGRDRRIRRGINETDAGYAVRLKRWLDDWGRAGTPYMLMQQLAAYCGSGFAFRTVDARGNWYSRDADGVETSSLDTGNWDWDGGVGARWARFWVIVYPNGFWVTTVDDWGDTDLDWDEPDHAWGSTITPNQATTLRQIVNDWKPAGTRCVSIILAFDPASFDPSAPEPAGEYGRWSKTTDGVRVASRLSTARYIDGATQ